MFMPFMCFKLSIFAGKNTENKRPVMISIQNAVLRNPALRFREPVSFTIETGEHIAITGPNGSGKSVLAQLITAAHPLREGKISYDFSPSPVYKNIKLIAFKDSYGPSDAS
jgi:molybdate transport system ATP-binding protein